MTPRRNTPSTRVASLEVTAGAGTGPGPSDLRDMDDAGIDAECAGGAAPEGKDLPAELNDA